MATTVTAPVGNTIALAEKYLPILDEIYKAGAKSSILDTAAERVRWEGAKKAYLFNTEMVGLAGYDRNAGFVPGDVNTGWEDYEITQDRGRSFMIDVMDSGYPRTGCLPLCQVCWRGCRCSGQDRDSHCGYHPWPD